MKKYVILTLAVLFGAVSASSANAALVAYWNFDEAPGGVVAADSSGNGYSATLRDSVPTGNTMPWDGTNFFHGATFAPGGKIGNYLFLNNVSPGSSNNANDYAVADTFTGITGNADRSVAGWIFLDSNTVGGNGETGAPKDQTIVSWGVDGNGTRWTIRADGTAIGGNYTLRTEVNGAGFQAGALPKDEWVHIAVTFTDSGASDELKLYVNGTLTGSSALNPGSGVNTSGANPVAIGTIYENNGRSFAGGLDDIRIYDEVLSASQIQALAAVPEPSTLLLGLGGMLGALMLRRKRAC